jgi:hypothetical protein
MERLWYGYLATAPHFFFFLYQYKILWSGYLATAPPTFFIYLFIYLFVYLFIYLFIAFRPFYSTSTIGRISFFRASVQFPLPHNMSDDDSWSRSDTPMFFSLLDESDQKSYLEMRELLHNSEKRYKRNKRIESLQEALDTIQEFCVRHSPDDWKRSLVCGVCWMGPDIAINTRQLRLLVDKCKSSINGALSKMGYGTTPGKSAISQSLLTFIPFLKGNFVEQRQWTIRRRTHLSPALMRNVFPTPLIGPMEQAGATSPDPTTPGAPLCREEPSEFKVFGIPELGKDWTDPGDDTAYNFITDPCCCCPIHWARDEGNLEDLFKFA